MPPHLCDTFLSSCLEAKARSTGSREEMAARSTTRLLGQPHGHLGPCHSPGCSSSHLTASEQGSPGPQASWLSPSPGRTVSTGEQEEVFGRADDKHDCALEAGHVSASATGWVSSLIPGSPHSCQGMCLDFILDFKTKAWPH